MFPFNRDIIINHKVIFCINSGRAGSGYLAKLLGSSNNIISRHEPSPQMIGRYLRMIEKKPYHKTYKKRLIKVRELSRLLNEKPENLIYAETSHMFIKTFFDIIISTCPNIKIIILRRKVEEILKSFIELNYFTDYNSAWPGWMSSPFAVTRAIDPISKIKDSVDLCIAYLIDIEGRAIRFMEHNPDIEVVQVKLNELNEYHGVKNLFSRIGLDYTDSTEKLIKQKINNKPEVKKLFNTSVEVDYCRERIEQYVEIARNEGIQIPQTFYMN